MLRTRWSTENERGIFMDFSYGFICLIGILFLCIDFHICVFWGEIVAVFCACLFLFFLIERTWSWTGKGMRRIWEVLEDGKIQKIFN